MSAVRDAIENEILDGSGLNCVHDYQSRWACVVCTRDVLTRIARLAASEALRMEIEGPSLCGMTDEQIVAAVLGEEVRT